MTTSTPSSTKVRENRLRAAADRQGLRLSKTRTRDPRALDYGQYRLIGDRGKVVAESTDLDIIEGVLLGRPA